MRNYRFCPLCGTSLKTRLFDGKKRNYCSECGFIHYENPLPSVGAIAIKDGKILLVKRKYEPEKGSWAPPSGFVESGEDPKTACLRELKEETGTEGRITKIIDVWLEQTEVYADVIVIIYLVEITGGVMVPGDDADEARFFTQDELPNFHFRCFREAVQKIYEDLS
jgi:ADP-ribose pyrophosphatase YjhB (NUDIX family)